LLRIAVASGKGGTGKTTIATNLAVAMAGRNQSVAYVDCDVEEPNGHVFLRPDLRSSRQVAIPVPEVDEGRCTLCGACSRACRFSAIVTLPAKVLTFPGLCHGCGGCALACPAGAVREVPRAIGVIEEGVSGEVAFLHGKLNVGEAMAPPVIRALLAAAPTDRHLVLDSPPGTSCPVIASTRQADVVLLVTEPTPFGLNDLKLAVELMRELGLPLGVAINRAGAGNDEAADYCRAEQIPVLMELRDDRAIARAYSRGDLALTALPELRPRFEALFDALADLAARAPRPGVRAQAQATTPIREGQDLRAQAPATTPIREGQDVRAQAPATTPIREGRDVRAASIRVGAGRDARELVVVSGKGGTGKTSVAASLFALAGRAAVADCDVDAADLHLILDPVVRRRWSFSGGQTAAIDARRCNGCAACAERCRFDAIRAPGPGDSSAYRVDPIACEGCGACVDICQDKAVALVDSASGECFLSDTRHGPMAHARLGIAQENSGKLVSLVRKEARTLARDRELLVCDGSPGIGCPVIASIGGAHMVLIVTEPTMSGQHDFERIADLCHRFGVTTGLCVNKADINPEIAGHIETEAARRGIRVLGRIRYDESVTAAQIGRTTVVEHGDGPAAQDIRAIWEQLRHAVV
jgi:MinD superfamily P-loop ATPase